MKNVKKIIIAITLLFSGHLTAATITWGAPTTNVNVGDSFTLDIIGTGFSSNVDGGGVSFAYNSSVLNVQSVYIDENVWDLGAGILNGTIDNVLGSVDGISVNAWSPVSGSFSVASVTFNAIGSGATNLVLSDWMMNPWASGGSLINPDYVDASISVNVSAVPVPAAVWLFSSGLIGLVVMARRKLG